MSCPVDSPLGFTAEECELAQQLHDKECATHHVGQPTNWAWHKLARARLERKPHAG